METTPVNLQSTILPVEYQLEILGYLIRDREVLSRFVETISEEHFDHPAHRVIYSIVKAHFAQYLGVMSKATLERELGVWLRDNSGRAIIPDELFWRELERLYGVSVAEREYVVNKIRSYLLRSQVAALGEEAIRAARGSGEVQITGVIEEINSLFSSISGRVTERMEYLLRDADRRVRDNPSVHKVPTGLRTLDLTLGGGLGKGELGVILAPTGWGKSFFLITVGSNSLRFQKRVLHVTLELGRPKVLSRYEAFLTRIAKSDLFQHNERVLQRLQRIRRLVNPAEVLVMEYSSGSLSVDELRAVLIQVRVGQGFDPDLLIVDYADIMKPVLTYRNEAGWEQLGHIYEGLRGIAQEFDLPIWTGSQATPDSMKKEVITIEDIAGSFSKARIADIVMAICRTKVEREFNKGRFFLDKNRDNRGHVIIPFKEDFDTSRFWEDVGAEAQPVVSRGDVEFADEV